MVSYSDQCVALASIASFLFGYQVAVLNTALVFYTLMFNACGDSFTYDCDAAKRWESLASTMVFVGATFGSLAGGYLSSRGRRFGLMMSHIISIIGSAICAFAFNFPSLLVGRAICGFCIGIITVVAPTFISEMCPAKIRGSRGTMHQLSITVGILGAVGAGMFLTQPPPEPDASYVINSFDLKWVAVMQGLPGILSALTLLLLLFVYTDDTPQALLGRGRNLAAAKVLGKIYPSPGEAEERLEELTEQMLEESDDPGSKRGFFSMISVPGCLSALIVGCVLSFGQQAGGINAFVARSTAIFKDSGMSPDMTTKMSTIMGFVNVIMTFPAIFLIDSLGRKPLMMLGVFGQAVMLSLVPLAAFLGYSVATASAVAVIGYMVFFATAYGPVLWVYLFEIYPPEFKATATGLASGLNWITGSLVVYLNGLFSKEYNVINFSVFAVACWAILLFVIFFVKETKGTTRSPFISTGDVGERAALKP